MREAARAFGLGEITLEDLREAARADKLDRPLADQLLRMIAEWETSPRRHSDWARKEFRATVRKLAPAEPAVDKREHRESLYEAGLRGQQRLG